MHDITVVVCVDSVGVRKRRIKCLNLNVKCCQLPTGQQFRGQCGDAACNADSPCTGPSSVSSALSFPQHNKQSAPGMLI